MKDTGSTLQDLKGTCEYSKEVKDMDSKVYELEGKEDRNNLEQNQRGDDPMIPIDIHPSYGAFRNVEQMVEHIGVNATVEAFIEGHTYALSKHAERTEANCCSSSLCEKGRIIEANFWNN